MIWSNGWIMTDYEALYNQFTQSDKSLLIAPAGYGKTHTIAACLKHVYEANPNEKALILTHTHAGVASIKEKVKRIAPGIKCQIETISSFAQKYVHAFWRKEIPEQDDSGYFPFIINKAAILFRRSPITLVLKSSYTRLFVDEYQDCTESQHEMILALSNLLPTHILGDPLQGIFSFNGEELVDVNLLTESFTPNSLMKPWRWSDNNIALGEWLKDLRKKLEERHAVAFNELNSISGCNYYQVSENDIYESGSDYRSLINKIVYSRPPYTNLGNTLLISQKSIAERVKLNQHLSYRFRLLEAFDEKDFYRISKKFDDLINSPEAFNGLMVLLKGQPIRKRRIGTLITGLSTYFSSDIDIPKRKVKINHIIPDLENFVSNPSYYNLSLCVDKISDLPDVQFPRYDLLQELKKALKNAALMNTSVFEEMKELRNIKRRVGRKVTGKCIGTTLLTKGLEFETVVVLDAHRFTDPKNFYVALTRASKRLIVFSEMNTLGPFG